MSHFTLIFLHNLKKKNDLKLLGLKNVKAFLFFNPQVNFQKIKPTKYIRNLLGFF